MFDVPTLIFLSFALGAGLFCLAAYLVMRRPSGLKQTALLQPAGVLRQNMVVGTQSEMSELRWQLFQAGFKHPQAQKYFVWVKVIFLLFGLGIGILAMFEAQAREATAFAMTFPIVGFMIGYYLPTYIVDRRRKAYLQRIARGLADALDFMLICVEAGQTTDMAILRTADELRTVHPDLSARFVALTEALAAGADRQDAYMKLAQETNNDDLRQFAAIIVQSTAMGTPVAQTLRVFVADLRDQHVRAVEAKANVLPTKMTLGTMMFTIPPLLILLLAPALFRISQSF